MIASRHARRQVVTAILVLGTITGQLAPASIYAQQDAISEARIVYLVLLDDSASMQRRPENPTAASWSPKIVELKRQMTMFIASVPNGTEVRFFAFAKELARGPQVVISSDADREKLSAFVNTLQARGQETRLWRSLDSVMGEAAELAQSEPGTRVRVLAYSDLEDNDPDRTLRSTVLAKYRMLLRQSQVQLTYITIGFELQAEQRKILENEGVQVRSGLRPEDVIPVQAEFRVVPDEVLLGERVTVVDDSIGVIRDRIVDWGDGTQPSQGRSPTHIYGRAGEYTVGLSVSSSTGQKSTATQNVRVVLPPAPLAAFKISADRVAVDAPVLLFNESTGTRCQFTWDFGDGRIATDTNPRVSWSLAGEYTIRLTVTDSFGRMDTAEHNIRIEGPKPPVAAMVVPKRVELRERVSLIDRSTGEIDSRTWFVEGEEVSSDRDYAASFTEAGMYAVRLVVKGPGGTDVVDANIEVLPPTAPVAGIAGPDSVQLGQATTFLDRSTGVVHQVAWYADGKRVAETRDFNHKFDVAGQHLVVLKVEGPGGRSQAEQRVEVVGPSKPKADFFLPVVVGFGESVNLVDRSSGIVEERTWIIAGDVVSTDRDAVYEFTAPGEHTIKLQVRGPGGTDIAERTLVVTAVPEPSASFVVGTPEPRVDEAVVLTDTSTGHIETATWYLPGREAPLVVDYGNGGARSIEFAFAEVGEQEVRLHVRGQGGDSDSTRKLLVRTRQVPPEPAVTTYVTESGHDYQWIVFKNRSKGSVVQTEYDFGDGSPTVTVAGVQDARHKYAPGQYVARVRIVGPKEFATEVVEIPINVPKPLPAWVWQLLWIGPLGVALLSAVACTILWWRKRAEDRRLSMLVGTLNYKPKGNPLAPYSSVQFPGTTTEERVRLSEATQAIVRALSDPLTSQLEHSVEVVDGNETLVGPVRLAENDRTTVGEYEFKLIQV